MILILDTHTFLWFLEGNANLSAKARKAIEDPGNTKFISIASLWEIAIKLNLGKLTMSIKLSDLKLEILKNNFEILSLDFEHILQLSKLENKHKDPFDRIIISQAISEKCAVISRDTNFPLYKKLKVIW